MEEKLPVFKDLSPTKGLNLDERKVLEHFLGKTRAEAEGLFHENPYHYWEDLMWMGARGFTFYCEAFFNYLRSIRAEGDSGSVSALCAIIEFRLKDDPQSIQECHPAVCSIVTYCIDNIQKFDLQHEIDKKIPKRLQKLRNKLSKLCQ